MTTTPAEHDPFFELLAEALRAGPGSAQWGEAVAKLRDSGFEGGDEYRLILRAREDIELGRDFRKVTAGPEFTRKVLDAVEREGTRKSGIPTATIVAILSGVVILGVIVTAIVIMSRGGGTAKDPQQAAVERLEATSLPVSVAAGSTPGSLNGFEVLRIAPATTPSTQSSQLTLGGLISTAGLDPSTPASLKVEINLPADGPQMVEVFVADGKPDAADGGAAREVVWAYRDGRATVEIPGEAPKKVAQGVTYGPLEVEIRFDGESVIVGNGVHRLYAGPHNLRSTPRYAGVRFVQTGEVAKDLRVKSISVAQAASPPAGGR
jgi:hypothetical protein